MLTSPNTNIFNQSGMRLLTNITFLFPTINLVHQMSFQIKIRLLILPSPQHT